MAQSEMSATDMLGHVCGLSAVNPSPRQWISVHYSMPKDVGMLLYSNWCW